MKKIYFFIVLFVSSLILTAQDKLADLPKIEEFEALAREKLGELSESELHSTEPGNGKEEQEQAAIGDTATPV